MYSAKPKFFTNSDSTENYNWNRLDFQPSSPGIPFPAGKQLSVRGTEFCPRPSDSEIAETQEMFMEFTGECLWMACMALPDISFA